MMMMIMIGECMGMRHFLWRKAQACANLCHRRQHKTLMASVNSVNGLLSRKNFDAVVQANEDTLHECLCVCAHMSACVNLMDA